MHTLIWIIFIILILILVSISEYNIAKQKEERMEELKKEIKEWKKK